MSRKRVDKSLTTYKNQAIKAAKDLRYSRTVVSDIKKAETIAEVSRIMRTARKKSIEKEENYEYDKNREY